MPYQEDMAQWEAEQRKKDQTRSEKAEALSKFAEEAGQYSQTIMREYSKQKRNNDRFPDSERVKWEKAKRKK